MKFILSLLAPLKIYYIIYKLIDFKGFSWASLKSIGQISKTNPEIQAQTLHSIDEFK